MGASTHSAKARPTTALGVHGEAQLLYSRLVTSFWELQVGLRGDLVAAAGARGRGLLVVGLEGSPPLWFEIEPALFVSHLGDVSARLRAAHDLDVTQRLIAGSSVELNVAVQSVPELGVGAGFNDMLGLRVRYEFARELAPYLGISWKRTFGETAWLRRDQGQGPGDLQGSPACASGSAPRRLPHRVTPRPADKISEGTTAGAFARRVGAITQGALGADPQAAFGAGPHSEPRSYWSQFARWHASCFASNTQPACCGNGRSTMRRGQGPMQKSPRSSISLGVALATLVLVASDASAKPPGPSKPAAEATDADLMVLTIIAVDVDTRLAFMCGLPKSKVFFKYDSAKLRPDAKERLKLIATCAKTGPAKGKPLLVVGRTDPRGSAKYNKELGKRRAEAVAKYLRELGVDQTQVETESKGDASASEAYPGAWPYDRRVTVRLQSSSGLPAPKAQTKITDQQITAAVAHTLLTDSALLNKQIAARVDNGIVTLSGTADHLMAKERAAKLAQTIRGVRGVVNEIALKTPWRSDDQIRKDVEAALIYDAATDSYELRPAVKNGVVTLRGTSQSYREKQLAVHVAKGVKGVKGVTDHITLTFGRSRSDFEIAAEVKRALSIDAWLAADIITTKVKNGTVTLTGAVGSYALHDRARLLAWTAGVKSVDTLGLSIAPWAKTSGQRATIRANKSDPQIKQAVHDGFVHDPRVFSFNPSVAVKNAVVTLTGVVDNLKAKRAAEQDAKNTVGVWSVKNLLTVRPAKPIADANLAQNVTLALRRDPFVDSYAINAKAQNGVVTLTGSVASYYEATQAEDIASRANGVLNVNNNLTVSYPALVYYDVGHDPYWALRDPLIFAEAADGRGSESLSSQATGCAKGGRGSA